MRRIHRSLTPLGAGLLAATLVALCVTPASAGPPRGEAGKGAASPHAVAAARGASAVRAVTLITGDKVLIRRTPHGPQVVDIQRADPGPSAPMVQYVHNGNLHVVPADTLPLVRSGAVDHRLFDVTGLVRQGYDDAARADLPLLVRQPARARVPAGARAGRRVGVLGATSVAQPKKRAAQVWRALTRSAAPERRALAGAVTRVWLDGRVLPSLDQSVPRIGAPVAWQAGLTGAGVKVAVLDSGYDPNHPDLRGVVTEAANFTTDPDTTDHDGHGTHVASTISGSGAASGSRFKGVAPGARLLVGKVLTEEGGSDSTVLAGMEWAASRAKVVNMSLGGREPSDGTDPVSQAVNTLTRQHGTLFVVAAGNAGGSGTVTSPAAADGAIAVGSATKADVLSRCTQEASRATR